MNNVLKFYLIIPLLIAESSPSVILVSFISHINEVLMLPNPLPYFSDIPDPRRETKNKLHLFNDVLMIVLCGVLSGFEDWVAIEDFALEKEDWFRRYLALPNGIPSHDTLSRVFGRIDKRAFAEALATWMKDALPNLQGSQVAIDGKSLRGSRNGDQPLHLVSAFAAECQWVLAQTAVSNKSNEIKAIPELIDLLDLSGAVVTIDAMGTQKAIAEKIHKKKADYVLALKDNHPTLCEDVELWLNQEFDQKRLTIHEDIHKGHGRFETRRYALSDQIEWLEQKPQWAGLQAVGMVESIREVGKHVSCERRFYLSTLTDLNQFATAVRGHWSIENQQHWILDVQFHEDLNRTRKDHAPANLALMRRVALNLLKADSDKKSLRRKKMRSMMNDNYRAQLLFGAQQKT